jgi:hypothetical protein
LGEKNDISAREPDTFDKMLAAMNKRLEETGAQLLSVNPDYDPSAQPQRRGSNR